MRSILGTDTTTDQKVAVKVEQHGCDTPQLEFEAKLYALLRGGYAIPKTHYYGVEPLGRVLAMDLLGRTYIKSTRIIRQCIV